jgi:hypothetical protein
VNILKKIKVALAGLLLVCTPLAVVALSAPPASAVTTSAACKDAFGKTACVSITFQPRNVLVTGITHSTPNGCGSLGSPRYVYKQASTSNKYYNWGSRDCGHTEAVYDGCSGCTSRTVTVYLKANVPWDYDYEYTFKFALRSDGSATAWTSVDVGACC